MSTSPRHARLTLAAFVAVGAGIVLNVLYFQDRTVATAAERAKLEKAQQRALAERSRRLAVDAKEGRDKSVDKAASGPRAEAPTDALTIARVGRFSTPATKSSKATVSPEPDLERSQDTVRSIQQRLAALGYEPGTGNGLPGLVLRAAVMAYEHDQGLPLTADPSEAILSHLENRPGARDIAIDTARRGRAPHAEQMLRSVQQALAALGYFQAKIDGHHGLDTERAIREYEMDSGLVPTGRVSAPLMNRLARSSSASRTSATTKSPVR